MFIENDNFVKVSEGSGSISNSNKREDLSTALHSGSAGPMKQTAHRSNDCPDPGTVPITQPPVSSYEVL